MSKLPDFYEFFSALWETAPGTAHARPFPWQQRLADSVAEGGWPRLIALPTGAGKTSVIDVWIWALAAGAVGCGQRQPRRLFFVIDRRIVVDSVFERAKFIAEALERQESAPLRAVATALLSLGGSRPLLASRLHGALEIDPTWAEDLAQPLVCASTVDQVGSRLLFRGYGLSSRRKNHLSVHAALLGNDALLVLDEAHLSVPFDETLATVDRLRTLGDARLDLPWSCVRMTATPRPGSDAAAVFSLAPDDEADPRLRRRLTVRKPATLVECRGRGAGKTLEGAITEQVCALLERDELRTLGVIVNRVARARALAGELRTRRPDADVLLLIGPSRLADRDRAIADCWPRMGAGRTREAGARRLVVVATQTIEVGADLDFDALVTECAAADALRQRFGRLDRLGELGGSAQAVVVYMPEKAPDSVYGSALAPSWDWLQVQATEGVVDVGPLALNNPPADALTPVAHAPVLFPAYMDRFCETSPLPDPDPAVSVFLHGFETGPADVGIVWRGDLDPDDPSRWREIVATVPPSGRETVRIGLASARRWLDGLAPMDFADVEGGDERDADQPTREGRQVLRWCGAHDEGTAVIQTRDVRPGDSIVVPAAFGGCDRDGWAPEVRSRVFDLAENVALEGGSPALRLHPAVLDQHGVDASVLQGLLVPDEDDLSLLTPDLAGVERVLSLLAECDGTLGVLASALLSDTHEVLVYPDVAVSGAVLVIRGDDAGAMGDDAAELGGAEVLLREHQEGVVAEAVRTAGALGIDDALAIVVAAAAACHDEGKRDRRFQRLLAGGAEFAPGDPLAKGRARVRDARALRRGWKSAGLPAGFRHEAVSTVLACAVKGTADDDLGRHLVASHHGCARPLLPVVADSRPWIDTTALERVDGETPQRFWQLTRRYGWWGLALLEAVLRLADHRQSARERS